MEFNSKKSLTKIQLSGKFYRLVSKFLVAHVWFLMYKFSLIERLIYGISKPII